MEHKLLHPHHVFTLFKYAVYAALTWNIWLFFQEEWAAAGHLFREGLDAARIIEAFVATIDTAAWVVLLLLFELETSLVSDVQLRRRRVKWTLHGIRAVCSVFIVYSFYGYLAKWLSHLDAELVQLDVCTLAGTGWMVVESLDEFVPLTARNCAQLLGNELYRLHGAQVVATAPVLVDVQRLAFVDVVNSAAWIFIVILLEVDVRLQVRGALTGLLLWLSVGAKLVTYSVLLLAALYWGFLGDFLDFWDAFLWLVAFVFIEMNLFQWHQEGEALAGAPVVRAH